MSPAQRSILTTVMCGLLLASPAALAAEASEALFLDNCAECHQPHGRGIRGIYPALAGSETVLGSGIDVALVLLIGRGEMPSFKGALTATQMTAIINYVRSSWGNSGEPVQVEQIAALLAQDGN